MKAGLLGEKLSHSFSPDIHQSFYRLTGKEGSYTLFECPGNRLWSFTDILKRLGYTGVNVTIPYKTRVIKYLNGLSDEAAAIGAVNTISFRDGKAYGYNTDCYGLKALIDSAGVKVSGAFAVILGTGGAARCALKLLRDMGAAKVFTASRSPQQADAVFDAISYGELDALPHIDILVNTTPCGMYPDTQGCPVTPSVIKKCGSVLDLIYNPAETKLLAQAREFGIKASGGLLMLCSQAVKAQEIWNGETYGPEIYNGVYEHMRKKINKTDDAPEPSKDEWGKNIVLTGMPGSGKTTVGRLLAKTLGMGFTDTDAMVEKSHGAIPDIFSREGEAAFRKYENDAALEASTMSNAVISTGGGIILDKTNMDALRGSGTIVFIDRPLEILLSETDTSGRPLLADGKEAIEALYRGRYGLYTSYADIIQQNASDAQNCVSELINKLEEL